MINVESLIQSLKEFESRINDILYESEEYGDYKAYLKLDKVRDSTVTIIHDIPCYNVKCYSISSGDLTWDDKEFYIPISLIECDEIRKHPRLMYEFKTLAMLIDTEKNAKQLNSSIQGIENTIKYWEEQNAKEKERMRNLTHNFIDAVKTVEFLKEELKVTYEN